MEQFKSSPNVDKFMMRDSALGETRTWYNLLQIRPVFTGTWQTRPGKPQGYYL
jgi:hypothetical protein